MTKSPPLFDVLSHTAVTRAQFKGAAVFGTSVARLSGRPDPRRSVTDERVSLRQQRAGGRSWRTGHAAFVAAFCNAIHAATGKRIRELPKNMPSALNTKDASTPARASVVATSLSQSSSRLSENTSHLYESIIELFAREAYSIS